MDRHYFETYYREEEELYRPFFNTIVGTFTFTCDLFFLATILMKPMLRSRKEYMVLGANILLDALFGAAYVDKGINAIARYYSSETAFAKIHPSECLKRPNAFVYAFVQPGAGMIMLFTAVDRLYSVMRPIRYLQSGMQYAATLMTGAYLSSMPTFLYTVVNALNGFDKDFKVHKHRTLLGIVTAADRRRLVKVTCTILLIAGSHVVLLLVPDVLLTFILDDPVELVHNGLLILTASQGAVNVFIYLLMQPELRPTFTCKTSVAAAPLPNTNRACWHDFDEILAVFEIEAPDEDDTGHVSDVEVVDDEAASDEEGSGTDDEGHDLSNDSEF